MSKKILVIASTSRRRIELLRRLGVDFIVIPPKTFEETHSDPYTTVRENAARKALSVLEEAPRGSVIVGADTVIYSRELGVIGKPRSLVEAEEILWMLRRRWHTVLTGVFIIDRESLKSSVFVEETRVKMRSYSREELRAYLATMEPIGKAGAYAIQGIGLFLVESIVGDYYNVVGLPVTRLYLELRRYGIDLLGEVVRKRVLQGAGRTG